MDRTSVQKKNYTQPRRTDSYLMRSNFKQGQKSITHKDQRMKRNSKPKWISWKRTEDELMPVESYNGNKPCPTQCRGGRQSSWDSCKEGTRFDLNINPWKFSETQIWQTMEKVSGRQRWESLGKYPSEMSPTWRRPYRVLVRSNWGSGWCRRKQELKKPKIRR